jgi:hypothetical protein
MKFSVLIRNAEELSGLLKAGDAEAQCVAGRVYQYGLGMHPDNSVTRDANRALDWYEKAAAQDPSDAQYELAAMLWERLSDDTEEPDWRTAHELYCKRRMAGAAELSREQALRIRVRYLTDGAVLGSRRFVDGAFHRYRSRFSARRRDGARRMKGAAWGGLCVLRDLRSNVLGDPA